jgi:hypothetical protein
VRGSRAHLRCAHNALVDAEESLAALRNPSFLFANFGSVSFSILESSYSPIVDVLSLAYKDTFIEHAAIGFQLRLKKRDCGGEFIKVNSYISWALRDSNPRPAECKWERFCRRGRQWSPLSIFIEISVARCRFCRAPSVPCEG